MQDPKSVERLRNGDVVTLKRLFKANHAKLFPLVFRLTRDKKVTDQVIRDSFKELWDDRAKIDPFEKIFLRLLSYSTRRAEKYREDHEITGIEGGARTKSGEKIVRELEVLPEDLRLIYLLHLVDGYSIRELARAFDKDENEVSELVGRALIVLDQRFEDKLERDVQPSDTELWP